MIYIEKLMEDLYLKLDKIERLIEERTSEKEEYLTVKEASIRLQCTPAHIYYLINNNKIKIVEGLGELKRIPMSQFNLNIDSQSDKI